MGQTVRGSFVPGSRRCWARLALGRAQTVPLGWGRAYRNQSAASTVQGRVEWGGPAFSRVCRLAGWEFPPPT